MRCSCFYWIDVNMRELPFVFYSCLSTYPKLSVPGCEVYIWNIECLEFSTDMKNSNDICALDFALRCGCGMG